MAYCMGIKAHRMKYHDLRDFLQQLEAMGELKRITVAVDPYLEMTEIADRVLRKGGPALLFRNGAHGGLNMIYRRPDGNIGWIDPRGNQGE